MFRPRHIVSGVGLAGLIVIGAVGCGVSGSRAASPTHLGTHHVKTAGHTAGTSPSPSSTPSTSSTPTSRSSPATGASTSPSGSTTTGSAPYNPVVTQVLTWVQAHTTLALGAPTWLPPMPASTGAYLAATTRTTSTSWAVILHGTAHPYGVNNPAIAASAATHNWVSFGIQHLSAGQLATSPLSLLEAYSQMGPSHPAITAGTATQVALGTGVFGTVYGNGTVLWHEGDWTLVVQGTSDTADTAFAKTVVAYLHTAYLPPHVGLVDIFQNTASVDWIQGGNLVSLQGGPVSALDVLHMAVTWRTQPS